MRKNISLVQAVEIGATPEKIFDYISDLTNDPLWRPEVESMEVKGKPATGTTAVEYITIYRFFHCTTPVTITTLERPVKFIAETPGTHPTWVQCIRTTEIISRDKTKFTVQLSFSMDNLKQFSPILPPAWIVRLWYNPRMKRYLQNLKRRIETGPVA